MGKLPPEDFASHLNRLLVEKLLALRDSITDLPDEQLRKEPALQFAEMFNRTRKMVITNNPQLLEESLPIVPIAEDQGKRRVKLQYIQIYAHCEAVIDILNREIANATNSSQSTPAGAQETEIEAPPSGRPATELDGATGGRGMRVLVAEDNEVSQKLMRLCLARLGCSLVIVGDGEQACEAVETDAFDCVFMDYRMPRLDGVAATKRIRAWEAKRMARGDTFAPLFIVGCSSNSTLADQLSYARAGMDDFVAKPVTREKLAAVLHRASALLR